MKLKSAVEAQVSMRNESDSWLLNDNKQRSLFSTVQFLYLTMFVNNSKLNYYLKSKIVERSGITMYTMRKAMTA